MKDAQGQRAITAHQSKLPPPSKVGNATVPSWNSPLIVAPMHQGAKFQSEIIDRQNRSRQEIAAYIASKRTIK
jgi:hypothetical protein